MRFISAAKCSGQTGFAVSLINDKQCFLEEVFRKSQRERKQKVGKKERTTMHGIEEDENVKKKGSERVYKKESKKKPA